MTSQRRELHDEHLLFSVSIRHAACTRSCRNDRTRSPRQDDLHIDLFGKYLVVSSDIAAYVQVFVLYDLQSHLEDWVSISVASSYGAGVAPMPEPLSELQRRSSCLREQVVAANGREADGFANVCNMFATFCNVKW